MGQAATSNSSWGPSWIPTCLISFLHGGSALRSRTMLHHLFLLLVLFSGGNTNRRHESSQTQNRNSESVFCTGYQRAPSQAQHTTRKHPPPPHRFFHRAQTFTGHGRPRRGWGPRDSEGATAITCYHCARHHYYYYYDRYYYYYIYIYIYT